jgi:hypothetical protein
MFFFGKTLLHAGAALDDVVVALSADDALLPLFPTVDGQGRRSGSWTTSWGDTFDKEIEQLPADILGVAYERWALGDRAPERFLDAAASVVADLRQLAAGQPIRVTGQVGLTGAAIESGVYVALPRDARLRAAGDLTPQPGLADDGEPVIAVEVEWHVIAAPAGERRSVPPNAHATLDRLVRTLRCAALTGVDVVVRERWRRIHDPVSYRLHQRVAAVLGTPVPLDGEAIDALRGELSLLGSLDIKPLDIAVERVISALDREDPRDGFIDAVVAWEALFSDQPGETTLRVCAAMTKLLEPEADARAELYEELAGMYGSRSRVLHGTALDGVQGAVAARDRAIELAVAALRALLHRRPDLIPHRGRGLRLILDLTC